MKKKKNDNDKLQYRSVQLKIRADTGMPETFDADTRSVEVVGATENPVDMWDYSRGEVIPEVLIMSGCRIPKSKQVPMLDSHDRYDSNSVIGSYRDIRIDGDKLIGRAFFSSNDDVELIFNKVKEGHLTDFSVGYRVLKSVFVPRGETQNIKGRKFVGPLNIATDWAIREESICPIGADSGAKIRNEVIIDNNDNNDNDNNNKNLDIKTESNKMDKKTRDYLESIGLRTDADDEEAFRFLIDFNKQGNSVDLDSERAAAVKAERTRQLEIRSMCKSLERTEMLDEFIDSGVDIDSARKSIMDSIISDSGKIKAEYRSPATVTADEKDKFRAAAEDSILVRAGINVEKPAVGYDDLTGYSLRELARHSLKIANRPINGGSMEMVGRALTTSDFPYLLANVANKSLFKGFETANETYETWCDTSGSVSDFKTNYLPRISESSDLEEIPEDTEYKYGSRTEAQETYSIATYGLLFPISRQAVINDDLNAITTISQAHGEAVQRKIGDLAYAVLTDNSAMGDSVALFHTATHANLASTGAAPGITTLATAIRAMKMQQDLKSLRRLNIRPEYFIAPTALEGAMEVFFGSMKYSDVGTAATDSAMASTRLNPYAGGYFTRVYEPRLDDSSDAEWYLAARKGKTVKLFFLDGKKTPYMEMQNGWNVDGAEYKVRIDVGAKALTWNGLYKNPGE